eukprot:CAMPEP_0172665884 /NCGR_PEP_ID=MMETSP1074-20121228/7503_1 /TAXON_ID=2916 /ORGANISM="Ceratium fusus, Strain PA161109" /LENGTH=41 /DNA_ID= /DNA_START= /DNA_END= /DNA_ORIENTATION=
MRMTVWALANRLIALEEASATIAGPNTRWRTMALLTAWTAW